MKKKSILIIFLIIILILGGLFIYSINTERKIPLIPTEKKETKEEKALKLLIDMSGLEEKDFEYIGKTWDEKYEFKLKVNDNSEIDKYYLVDLKKETYDKEERMKEDISEENIPAEERVEITDEDVAGTEYVDITGGNSEEILSQEDDIS